MTISESPNETLARSGPDLSDVFTGPVGGGITSIPARDAVRAYQPVAWRAPTSSRFDGRPANDFLLRAEAIAPLRVQRPSVPATVPMPAGWLTFTIGAGVAALLGMLVGGVFSV